MGLGKLLTNQFEVGCKEGQNSLAEKKLL